MSLELFYRHGTIKQIVRKHLRREHEDGPNLPYPVLLGQRGPTFRQLGEHLSPASLAVVRVIDENDSAFGPVTQLNITPATGEGDRFESVNMIP